MADAPADPFSTAKTNLRDTVKWLAAALAGVAAAALGSSPLTALGSLPASDQRLHLALAALGIAVVCFVCGIAIVLNLLIGDIFFLEDVRADGNLCRFVDDRHHDLLPPDYPTLIGILDRRAALAQTMFANRNTAAGAAYQAAQEEFDALAPILGKVSSLLYLEKFRQSVRCARWSLLVCALGGGAALSLFAWAANPPKPPAPAAAVAAPFPGK